MIREIYQKHEDITFIMEEIEKPLDNNMMQLRQRVIGWYYGVPNEADTKLFAHKLEAVVEYELEEEQA